MASARRFGPYRLMRKLGGADSRDVYLAKKDDQELIVAFVDADPEATSAEVERCRALRHPAVLPVVEVEQHEGRTAVVYAAVSGRTLARVCERLAEDGEWLPDSAIWFIGNQVAAALAAAHRLAMAHAGLTPEQVILTWTGQVRLAGLGVSGAFEPVPNEPWLGFAAPEVRAGGPPSPESNTYAVGATLWWLASRAAVPPTPPSLGELRSELPPNLVKAIDRALSPDPADRGSCTLLGGVTHRNHEGGQAELVWNMEIFRSLDMFDDDLPSSLAFPSSAPPRPSRPISILPGRPTPEKLLTSSSKPMKVPKRRSTLESARDDLLGKFALENRPIEVELARDEDPNDATDRRADGLFGAVRRPSSAPPSDRTEQIPFEELMRDAEGDARAHERVKKDHIARAMNLLREHAPPPSGAADADTLREPEPMFPDPESERSRDSEDVTRQVAQRQLAAPPRPDPASEWGLAEAVPYPPAAPPAPAFQPAVQAPIAPPQPRLMGSTIGLGIAVALSAIVALSAGIWVTNRLRADPGAAAPAPSTAPADAPRATPIASPGALAADPAPTPSPKADAPPPSATPPGSAAPSASAASPTNTGAEPAPGMGILRVVAPMPDAGVYVQGSYAGRVGEPIELPCRMVFVRVGTVPLNEWFNRGEAVEVPCGGEVTVEVKSRPSP